MVDAMEVKRPVEEIEEGMTLGLKILIIRDCISRRMRHLNEDAVTAYEQCVGDYSEEYIGDVNPLIVRADLIRHVGNTISTVSGLLERPLVEWRDKAEVERLVKRLDELTALLNLLLEPIRRGDWE